MTDPYAQSYRDYSYLVLKRSVRFALRGRSGRLIQYSRVPFAPNSPAVTNPHAFTTKSHNDPIMALVTTLQNVHASPESSHL